jgi:hypothetical protein
MGGRNSPNTSWTQLSSCHRPFNLGVPPPKGFTQHIIYFHTTRFENIQTVKFWTPNFLSNSRNRTQLQLRVLNLQIAIHSFSHNQCFNLEKFNCYHLYDPPLLAPLKNDRTRKKTSMEKWWFWVTGCKGSIPKGSTRFKSRPTVPLFSPHSLIYPF